MGYEHLVNTLKPVEVWRKELDIVPIRQGQNRWYEVLAGLEL